MTSSDYADRSALVTGAGGFIGGHLVAELLRLGCRSVRAVDIRPVEEWYQVSPGATNVVADLRDPRSAVAACEGASHVYNLAADMGGIGFIETHRARCMLNVLINTHLLEAARAAGVSRYFFASSACVYSQAAQRSADVRGLREPDAYPADPEDGYGWEKLFSERMCRHFREDFGIETRVARFHNIYGPHGAYDGGREKAPAAICRKVAEAVISGDHRITIWGDGRQTRSFTYVDDCVTGILRITDSDVADPLNLGSDEQVTINELVDLAEGYAGIELERTYDLDRPTGVRGRNSDNGEIVRRLRWAPSMALKEGLSRTYAWIDAELRRVGNEALEPASARR